MAGPSEDKPWYQKLPAKAGAVVVFLVALTTLLGNLLELDEKRRRPADPPVAAAPAATASGPSDQAQAAAPASAPSGGRWQLQLERIVVRSDGSVGTTDWRFSVEADGQPLMVLQQDDLDDAPGRNVVLPRGTGTALDLEPGKDAVVAVKAWRLSRLRLVAGEPDAAGEGRLSPDGRIAPITVQGLDARDGDFSLHFSTSRGP